MKTVELRKFGQIMTQKVPLIFILSFYKLYKFHQIKRLPECTLGAYSQDFTVRRMNVWTSNKSQASVFFEVFQKPMG